MEPNFVCIIRFDFCLKSNNNTLEEKLNNLYQCEKKQVLSAQGLNFGVQQQKFDVYENKDYYNFDYFATIMVNEIDFITDVITIAILSKNQVDKIIEGETKLDHFQEKVNDIRNDLPVYTKKLFTDHNTSPVITFIRPDNHNNIFDNDYNIDIEKAKTLINDNSKILNKFNFSTYSIISLIKGDQNYPEENFVTLQKSNKWGPLTIFNTGLYHKSYLNPDEYSPTILPTILDDFLLIRNLFRGFYWLEYRINQINEINQKSYDILSQDFKTKNWDNFIRLNNEQEKLNNKWIKLSQKTFDELYKLEEITPFFNYESLEYEEGVYDYPIKFNHGLNLVGKPNSLIFMYMTEIKYLFNKINSDLKRVQEKQNQISTAFHDEINIRSIKTTLSHTKTMTKMTKVILAATIISLLIAIDSKIDFYSIILSIINYIKSINLQI